MHQEIIIHWFRQDLRIVDNPSLFVASSRAKVLPVYILDDINARDQKMGSASRWWLHYSLNTLNSNLNNNLSIHSGDSLEVLLKLVKKHKVKGVYWNRCYEPWCIARDKKIKEVLQAHSIEVNSFNGSLLWEPWEVLKSDDTPYKVFTPFYKNGCLKASSPREPFPKPENLIFFKSNLGISIDDLKLLPKIKWYKKFENYWTVGEAGARERLKIFIEKGLCRYREGRDFPAKQFVSRLSPHLHFGEISPNTVWYTAKEQKRDGNLDHFLSELAWREFSYSLLYHFPDLTKKNLQSKFDKFPWINDKKKLKAWQRGQTGYPIVDAGMRELWETGYMHNRVRMIVASFLVKNLLLHWHCGEAWFWDCLVDADLANNSASWQWVAGCGADAAPYFRIFNPITQGKKFDPEGVYTRQFVPELKNLSDKYLFSPWEAPKEILQKADIILGKNYPYPIVDLKTSREQALKAFESIRNK